MKKQVRAFNLDHDLGSDIDAEAALLGPNKASALVNELLREALKRRKENRIPGAVMKAAVIAGESAAGVLLVTVVCFALLLVL